MTDVSDRLRHANAIIDAIIAAGGAVHRQPDGTVLIARLPAGHPLWTHARAARDDIAAATRPPLQPCSVCRDPRGVGYLDRGLLPLCRRHIPWR